MRPPRLLLPGLLVTAGLLLGGCELFSFRGENPSSSDRVILREGEAGPVAGGALTFVGKVSESRCPIGGTCVWPGEALAEVRFQPQGGAAATFRLLIPGLSGSDDEGGPPVDTLGYRFTLLRLDPYPSIESPQPDARSTATLRVERQKNR